MEFVEYLIAVSLNFYTPVIGDCIDVGSFRTVEKVGPHYMTQAGSSTAGTIYLVVDSTEKSIIARRFLDRDLELTKLSDYLVAIPRKYGGDIHEVGSFSKNSPCILREDNMTKMEKQND